MHTHDAPELQGTSDLSRRLIIRWGRGGLVFAVARRQKGTVVLECLLLREAKGNEGQTKRGQRNDFPELLCLSVHASMNRDYLLAEATSPSRFLFFFGVGLFFDQTTAFHVGVAGCIRFEVIIYGFTLFQ